MRLLPICYARFVGIGGPVDILIGSMKRATMKKLFSSEQIAALVDELSEVA